MSGPRPMYGRLEAYGRRGCGCCDLGPDKAKARRLETEQWQRDWHDEIAPSIHPRKESPACSSR